MKVTKVTRPLVNWLIRSRPAPEFPLSDFERIRYELRPCDVILVEGRTRVSEVIKMITQSSWSHAALYLGRLHDIEDPELRETVNELFPFPPDTQLIVESELGLGTVIRDLASYQQDHIRICRPRGLNHKDSQQMIHYAISQLGKEYDVRQILDLARFLFPWWVMPRRWRSSLFQHNPGTATRTVCSTMIAEAFGFIQFPILPLVKKAGEDDIQLFRRNPKLCTPRDFDYSPYFEIIKYPFMDFSEHSDYRLLPWHGKGVLSGEEASMYMSPETYSSDRINTEQRSSPEHQQNESNDKSSEDYQPDNTSTLPSEKAEHRELSPGHIPSPQTDEDFYNMPSSSTGRVIPGQK